MTEVQQIGIAIPASHGGIISKDAVDLGDIGEIDLQFTQRGILNPCAIEGLLILAPSDIAHKTRVIQADPLATQRDYRIRQ